MRGQQKRNKYASKRKGERQNLSNDDEKFIAENFLRNIPPFTRCGQMRPRGRGLTENEKFGVGVGVGVSVSVAAPRRASNNYVGGWYMVHGTRRIAATSRGWLLSGYRKIVKFSYHNS